MNINSFNDLPKVESCSAEECAYNKGQECHAAAITVSETNDPKCSTFSNNSSKGGVENLTAGVGACLQSNCQHNVDLECGASAIVMAFSHGMVNCSTYSAS